MVLEQKKKRKKNNGAGTTAHADAKKTNIHINFYLRHNIKRLRSFKEKK